MSSTLLRKFKMGVTKSFARLVLLHLVSYLLLSKFSRCFEKSIQTLPKMRSSGLLKVLKEASTDDRIVILTLLHAAEDSSALELFIMSFQLGEGTPRFLNHLIILVPDSRVFRVCKSIHPRCYNLANVQRNKPLRSSDQVAVEWRRNMLVQEAIESGYSLIYTDVDVLWFRNPFPLVRPYDTMVMAPKHASDSQNEMEFPGGGFFYMQSNELALEFLKLWNFERILHPGSDAQSILDMIVLSIDEFLGLLRNKMRYLDTADYGDFCGGSIDLSRVYIARVNCSRERERKIHEAEILLDSWKTFMNKQHQSITAE